MVVAVIQVPPRNVGRNRVGVLLTVIPVVVGIPSFSQVFRAPWKWSVCG